MKALYIAVPALFLSLLAASAEDGPGPKSALRLIIQKSGNDLKSINIASGTGADVQFFTNLDDLSIEWTTGGDQSNPVRSGTYAPDAGGRPVTLGVCAGGMCDAAVSGFATRVGGDLPR